jgi:hypothetical protein
MVLCSSVRYKENLYCLAIWASFYSDAVECLPDLEPGGPGFNPHCGQGFFWLGFIGAQRKKPTMCVSRSKDLMAIGNSWKNFANGGGVCSRVRYKENLYCLAIWASFYSNAIECLPDWEPGGPGFNPHCGRGFFWLCYIFMYLLYLIIIQFINAFLFMKDYNAHWIWGEQAGFFPM